MLKAGQKVTTIEIQNFIDNLKKIAEEKGKSAGLSGEWGDGGEAKILEQIAFYVNGINHTFPEEWTQFLKEIDPTEKAEYEEYLRLQKKFK